MYIQKIQSVTLNNKYTGWYIGIVRNAQGRAANKKTANKLLGYSEAHHILPKSFDLGGIDDKKNIVHLTAREHFLCHILLTKMVTGRLLTKMWYALYHMKNISSRSDLKISSRYYEIIRLAYSNARKTSKGPRTGSSLSAETRRKISESRSGITPWNKGLTYTAAKRPDWNHCPWNKGKKTGHTPWNAGLIGWMSEDQKDKQRAAVRSYRENNPDWYIKSFGNPEVREASEQLRLKAVSKRTVVYGVIYDSASQAAIDLGMKKTTLIKRILSKNYPDYMYVGENK